jgi:hypothetical protein
MSVGMELLNNENIISLSSMKHTRTMYSFLPKPNQLNIPKSAKRYKKEEGTYAKIISADCWLKDSEKKKLKVAKSLKGTGKIKIANR